MLERIEGENAMRGKEVMLKRRDEAGETRRRGEARGGGGKYSGKGGEGRGGRKGVLG